MVDGAHQIIVAAETCDAANDKEQAVPMADATLANLEAAGIEWPQGVAAKDKEPAVPMADATRSSGEATGIEQPQDQGQPATAGQTVAVAQRIPLSADNGYFSEGNVGGLERGASIRTWPRVGRSTTSPRRRRRRVHRRRKPR